MKRRHFSHTNFPCAKFEGIRLEYVSFESCNLASTIFRSTKIEDVSFCSCNLQDAIFDFAKFINNENNLLDFRDSEIGGVSLIGVINSNIRLQNTKISKPTRVAPFLNSPIFEFKNGDWDTAAYIYSTIADRARKDWDNLSEDNAVYLAMTCRHRLIINAAPCRNKFTIKNWVLPTFKAGLNGIWWYFQRIAWGYGYKPFRLLSFIIIMILLFSAVFVFVGNDTTDNLLQIIINSLFLSTQSFFSMTYGNILPSNKFCEAIGTFEAFVGTILISFFLVSLTVKFMRRI